MGPGGKEDLNPLPPKMHNPTGPQCPANKTFVCVGVKCRILRDTRFLLKNLHVMGIINSYHMEIQTYHIDKKEAN